MEEMANSLLTDCDVLPNIIAKYNIRLDNIWNFNKTGFIIGLIIAKIAIISSEI
ncbi:hypothetical protein FOC1_g10000720 [Fusarium oxysporum f. sp. cubense race 1]|uniref:Uncharacterized protein n=1 Tax=Fusarium oxysporum f. sp. cubense (strain race 1) TaxID=1229664 RepID=N4UUI7_FUSC1|nr:hypothetical protein FOC1_g10000720 [Fusarium oxysporum f. sp. cubense race 1]